ncbi:MAG: ABC transporter ATP-binding protein/permease [Leptospiraceae bacterium]|nr:ABC transporter ATP-binding protein/permease [Leptospiraceae bacterium]
MSADAQPRGKILSGWRGLSRLLRWLWPANHTEFRVRIVAAVFFLIAAKVTSVGVPYLLKIAVDMLSVSGAVVPLSLLFGYAIARFSVQVFGELRDYIFIRVAQRAQRQIALETFEHLHALSLRFHLDRQTGGISRVIERGTRGIQFALNFLTFNILPTLFEILLVTAILAWLFSWPFATIIFTTIVSYIAFTLIMTEWRIKYRKKMNESDNRANQKAVDSLLNYETVKYFGNEEFEKKRYDDSLIQYENAAVRSQRTLTVLNLGQNGIIAIGLFLIMYLAAAGVSEKQLSVGDFVLLNTYLIQLYIPLNFLGFVYRELKQSFTDMDEMFQLLETEREIQDAPDAEELKIESATVEFKDVSFYYESNRKILNRISFHIPDGKKLAVVGASGAGKSTLSRLVFRYYDVTSGGIFIDGHDIRNITQRSLRKSIGIVPQDTVLFNDTIGYNIAYGKPGASNEEIEQAARLASIHDFIRALPQGYETMVGERGLKLSGGEKQRVAIARTILKNPPMLLFDEATSSLDTNTEREIQKALAKVSRKKTTLMIAHRLSTIIDADEIIVLEKGQIVERGTHKSLLNKKGVYYKLWQMQQSKRAKTKIPVNV